MPGGPSSIALASSIFSSVSVCLNGFSFSTIVRLLSNTRSGIALLSNVSKNSLSVAMSSLSRFAIAIDS